MNFSKLRDYIQESETIEVGSILTSEEIQNYESTFGDIGDIGTICARLSQMGCKQNETLNTLDYDDTLSSRDRSLQESKFMDNRGQAGNDLIEREYGYDEFVYSYYRRRDTVSELVNVIMSDDEHRTPFLLTAGIESLQKRKLERTKLKKQATSVVEKQSLKPQELLRHIMDDLGYIPGKIIVYEDRPDCFLETGPFLAKLLGCEIVVNHVTLSQSHFNKIDTIKQTIYKK